MKTEREQCKEILARFCADGKFETTDRAEVYAIYLLQRMGCVVADMVIDSAQNEYSAKIREVTTHGKETLLRNTSNASVGTGLPMVERQKIAVQAQLENDKAKDSVLLHLASGGIGLAFGLMSFQTEIDKTLFCVWAIATGIWILSLLSLLFSFTTSRIMYNNDPSLYSSKKSADAYAIAGFLNRRMNRAAEILFVLGLIMFTIFVVIKVQGRIKEGEPRNTIKAQIEIKAQGEIK